MRLLLTVGKRLWDAAHAFVAVLWGRREIKQLTPSARVKHAARLQRDLLEVAGVLEQMHAWTSRMSARDSRAAKKVLEREVAVTATRLDVPLSQKDRKDMLRAYVAAKRHGIPGVPPPPPVVAASVPAVFPSENGDECEECD